MGILKEEEWKWADEDNKADDVDVLSSSAHFHSSSFKIPIFFNLQSKIFQDNQNG
jgi:hypothetical protein